MKNTLIGLLNSIGKAVSKVAKYIFIIIMVLLGILLVNILGVVHLLGM